MAHAAESRRVNEGGRDVRPLITHESRPRPVMARQRTLHGMSPDRTVRFARSASCEEPANHRRSLSEIGRSRRVDVPYKSRAPRSRSVDIDLRERSAAASSRAEISSFSHHSHRYNTRTDCDKTPSHSTALSRSISLTRPIAWFRKRWLFHQLSDSGTLGDRIPLSTMHQDRKMTRSASVVDVDIKTPFPSAGEARRSKHQKMGPHPKKKMMRSHSESAIDLNVIKSVMMKHSSTVPDNGEKPAGVICSNEDFKKILTDSKRHRFGRKRNNTMVIQLESTPEAPVEAEIQLDNRLSEEESTTISLKERMVLSWERRGSRDKVTKLPMRQCAGSNPNSPAHLSEAKRDIARLSPIMLHKNNVNSSSSTNARIVHLSPKSLTSRLVKCDANSDELEPMLPRDKNGNPLVEKSQIDDDLVTVEEEEEQQNENIPTNIENENENVSNESAFDAQLLGEAIERHLAMQKQSSPGRKSPRYGEGRKRSGSLKSMLGQNNSQISARLGNLISRFPFKREGSVSPTNSENGVTV